MKEGESAEPGLTYDEPSNISDDEFHAFKRSRRSPSGSPELFVPAATPPLRVPTREEAEKEAAYRQWVQQQERLEQHRKWTEENNKFKVQEILKAAAVAAEKAASLPQAPTKDESTSKRRPTKPKQSKEEKEALKEKRLMKLVGAVVVKCLSKYQKQMDHDTFKEHAKHVGGCFTFASIPRTQHPSF